MNRKANHSEEVLQRCSYKNVFRKYAANLQENVKKPSC